MKPITPKKKKVIIIVAVAAALVVVGGFVIHRMIAARPFVFAGTLETTKVILSARVASDISNQYVIEGDTVQSGQVLMELSCDTYKVLAHQIDGDYERAAALQAKGHLSQAEFDVMTRNKQDNDLKLDWCQIKSPIDGMVMTKFREVGEVVAPGTALISLANPYDIWAYFYVPYDMLHKLRVGQSVTGLLPEAPDQTFPGRIIKISEEAEFTPKNVQTREERTRLVYGIKVKFDNPNLTLKSGMTIESNLIDE
ncbi:MAG: HlyD family efflux transporter periplasmic adaptor subunit [Alphaproteobacteria bacterium]|nr:HlyD family efflux transporter periplasmic adaptor subunit [Alphaproteobacteria bacterium]